MLKVAVLKVYRINKYVFAYAVVYYSTFLWCVFCPSAIVRQNIFSQYNFSLVFFSPRTKNAEGGEKEQCVGGKMGLKFLPKQKEQRESVPWLF